MSGVTCPKHQTGGGPCYCQQMHTCRCGATVERSKTVEYRTKGWQPRRVCKSCHIEGNLPKSWKCVGEDAVSNPFVNIDGVGAVDGASRLMMVDRFDIDQCRAGLTVAGLQKAVEKKLLSRIRKLGRA